MKILRGDNLADDGWLTSLTSEMESQTGWRRLTGMANRIGDGIADVLKCRAVSSRIGADYVETDKVHHKADAR